MNTLFVLADQTGLQRFVMVHEKLNIRGLKRGNVFLSHSSFPPVVGLSHVVTSRFHHQYIGLTFPGKDIGINASIEPLGVK